MEKERAKKPTVEQGAHGASGDTASSCCGGSDRAGDKSNRWKDFCKEMAGAGKMAEMMKMCSQAGKKPGEMPCCADICGSILNTKTKEK